MENIFWAVLFAAIAAIGVLLAVRGNSWAWRIAGAAFALGGLAVEPYYIAEVGQAHDPQNLYDIGLWGITISTFSLMAAMVLALVAMGRAGRRRFLIVFAIATLAIGTYEFWTSNWAARTGPALDRCVSTRGSVPREAHVQRVPPGVSCSYENGEVFVAADGISWLALVGWSIFWALLATYPIMGAGWALRRRPSLRTA